MGCDCARSATPEEFLNTFWKDLIIRLKDIEDVASMISSKKGRAKKISDAKFIQFVEGLLENPNFHEESMKVFQEALSKARDKKEEGYFFIAITFLSLGKLETYVSKFVSLWKTHIQAKNTLFDETENKKTTIRDKNLKELISFYINMITRLGIPFISSQAENKQDIIDYFDKPFSEENQTKFIEEHFFKEYEGNEIDVEQFFSQNLVKLRNDAWIRDELMKA